MFFRSRADKEALLLAQHARKMLHRRRDLLSAATIADAEANIQRLEAAARQGEEPGVKAASEQLEATFGHIQPAREHAALRENCEVLLVAFVLAIGVRAYFLQPFKIPTGSMQPTLNGITAHPLSQGQAFPNIIVRTFQSFWRGRTYVDVVAEADDEIVKFVPETWFRFFEYTRIVCESGRTYLVHAAPAQLAADVSRDGFGLNYGQSIHAGERIVRGYVDTGDQVFVDKFTYNFRLPKRGDVFVFSTRGISGIPMPSADIQSEFYIKRLAGVGGDTLRVKQPQLFVNGPLAAGAPFERVMRAQDGYRGYSNTVGVYLRKPDDTFTVPAKSYFAMGDNSFNSSDSRAWGAVPANNVVGRGLFVYWPFTRHWGFIN